MPKATHARRSLAAKKAWETRRNWAAYRGGREGINLTDNMLPKSHEHPVFETILGVVDNAYPDHAVAGAFFESATHGDTLALFIARELSETFDPGASPEDQWTEATRVIRHACGELEAVYSALIGYSGASDGSDLPVRGPVVLENGDELELTPDEVEAMAKADLVYQSEPDTDLYHVTPVIMLEIAGNLGKRDFELEADEIADGLRERMAPGAWERPVEGAIYDARP